MYQDSTSSHPYFVYTPTISHVGTAVPLLVMLHGCTQTAADFAAGTRMNQLAEQYGFIVLYPQQTRKANRTLCWNWFRSAHQFRDRGEPAMIAHMVQAIRQDTSQWTIDSNQIYVVGASAGAAMAVILAWNLARHSKRRWLSIVRRSVFILVGLLLLLSPTNSAPISALAGVLVGIYALGLTRAWQLLGGRGRQLNDWLTPLRDTEDRHSVTDTDQSLAASSARNDEPG